MIADDKERREVARRLRNVEKRVIPDAKISYNPMTVEFISAAVFYDLPYVRGLFSRLADLIEPDTTTDTTKYAQDTTKCDRDALLALADESRRAERTCNVESSHVEQEIGDYSYLEVELSCGHAFTWDDGTPPDYCPYCGARVVDE